VNRESGKPSHEPMFAVELKKLRNLKTFGEMVVVTIKKKIQVKLRDRDTACMFVEYTHNHSDDVKRLFNIKTRQVMKSRNLIC
jgi:hypothetical protein